jgi:hypothetical protein
LSQKNKQNKQKIKFLAVAQAAWSSTVGPEVTCRPRQQQPREEKKSRGIGYLPPHTSEGLTNPWPLLHFPPWLHCSTVQSRFKPAKLSGNCRHSSCPPPAV